MFGESRFVFLANYLCLDFVNTQIVENGRPIDLISDLNKFINWLVAANALSVEDAAHYVKIWHELPAGEGLMKQVHQLRATLRTLAESFTTGNPVSPSVIAEINAVLQLCNGYARIDVTSGKFNRSFVCNPKTPICLLYPIVESVSNLLCERNHSLIRRCENPNCILYFYDISKNHSRRWCNMNTCGNRIKVAAHYRRHRPV